MTVTLSNMAARKADVSLLSLVIFLCLCFVVKKRAFIQPDGISITLREDDLGDIEESFINASLWQNKKKNISRSTHKYGLFLVLLCGDVETCPGPNPMEEKINTKGIHMYTWVVKQFDVFEGNIWDL